MTAGGGGGDRSDHLSGGRRRAKLWIQNFNDVINCSERNWLCSDLQFDSGALTSAVGLLILKSEHQYQPRLDIKMSMEKYEWEGGVRSEVCRTWLGRKGQITGQWFLTTWEKTRKYPPSDISSAQCHLHISIHSHTLYFAKSHLRILFAHCALLCSKWVLSDITDCCNN